MCSQGGIAVIQNKPSETTTENLFREFYGVKAFIEKSAIPSEYGFTSKSGKDEDGYPDFFRDKEPEYVIVVEAKKTNHGKAKAEVQFYMKNNAVMKDIIGIAISGQSNKTLKVSYYLRLFSNDDIISLDVANTLLPLKNIEKIYKKAKKKEVTTEEHLTKTLHSINKQFHDENIVRDTERSLFFSGLMIALKDNTFRQSYKNIQAPSEEETKRASSKILEAHNLNDSVVSAITRQLESKINNLSKEYNWKDKFSFIKTIDYPLLKYKKLIKQIEENIFVPFENEEKQDILGRAYKIFLSKAGKVDNKNIILTPDHIKSLMVRLARLTVDDVVLDTCTGSGGFLMESMEKMISLAKGNEEKIKNIREKQLIGFETDSVLFALACSNMFLHGDGRTNLIFRSSLLNDGHDNVVNSDDNELLSFIHKSKPTKIIINPPYENNKPIRFTLQAIDYLEPNGKLIIIMPTPTLTHNQGGLTEALLAKAKLDFVIRMPERLFAEQKRTVNTSIFGFSKTPHQQSDTVLFYNLSDDGFVSIQHKGRVDKNKNWPKKEEEIADTIFAADVQEGVCEKRKIYRNGILNCAGIRAQRNGNYEMIPVKTLFNYSWGTIASESNDDDGEYDFITASVEWKKHSSYSHDCEALVFAVAASGSLGRAHYVNGKFVASNLCVILTSKNNPKYKTDLRFYRYYFDSIREQLRSDLADGTSKLTIDPDDLLEYFIEYIPYDQQVQFYENNIKPFEQLKTQAIIAENNLHSNILNLLKK